MTTSVAGETRPWEPVLRVYDPLIAGSIDGTTQPPHDRAIVRAMNATYHPNRSVVGVAERTLFVARLNYSTTETALREVCEKAGQVTRLRLVRDIVTGASKGYAFVEFIDALEARRARRNLDGATLDGNSIAVDEECERLLPGWVPRRLGGGIGGRREAGQLRFGGRHRPFVSPISMNAAGRGRFGQLRDRHDDRSRQDDHSRHQGSRRSHDETDDRTRERSKRDRSGDRKRDRNQSKHREKSREIDRHRHESKEERGRGRDRERSRDRYLDRNRENEGDSKPRERKGRF